MTRAALVLLMLCLPFAAHARPSPYPPITQFNGDRYASQAHLGPEVVRSIKAKQGAKARYLYPTRKRPPVVRQNWRHVPLPAPRPLAYEPYRVEAPLSVLEAIKRPAAWCGWWLGQHLGMPARNLWLARNWAKVGSSTGGPRIGAIVVWPHHVGIITGRQGKQWVVKSGNDGHRVRERPRSIAGAIAFRST